MKKLTVIFCCSGGLGAVALRAVLNIDFVTIKLLLTDQNSEEIIKIAGERGIPVFARNPRCNILKGNLACDVIASVNYLFVLPAALLSKARKLAFNIHGSLLPRYMGRTPVTWVIINDEVETGITAHEMVAEVDAGPILVQQKVAVTNEDTGGSLLKKLARRYPVILRKVFEQIGSDSLIRVPQELSKRTYFGKREPSDGMIDWRWSARRIYNWVRAQTMPYPGAFGFIKGKKYRIWKVEELSARASSGTPGTVILDRKRLVVTCGCGSVRLVDYVIEG